MEPAVAIVELVNENSIVESWFSGRLLGKNTKKNPGTWTDIPARYGGDEFVVILPQTDGAAAKVLAEKLRRRGYAAGLTPAWKKAMVVLKEGDTIALFEGK